MRRITIACPAAHTDDANQLAMVLGYGPADGLTYSNVGYQDALGNLYACASLPVGDSFVSTATSQLQRPEWDTEEVIDMDKAAQAQGLVLLWMPNEDDFYPPQANPSQIVATIGMGGQEAISAMGLTAINNEVNQ
jgi:hypothetical protein